MVQELDKETHLTELFLDIGDLQMINEYLKLAYQSGSENWR